MKKRIALIMALCLVFTSFAACTKTSGRGGRRSSGDDSKSHAGDETTRATDPEPEPSDTTRNDPTPTPAPTEPVVNITPSENTNIEWVTSTCPEGYISINAPKGWYVSFNNIDTIGYEIIVTAPGSDKCFYFCTSVIGYPSYDNFQY